MSSFSRRGEGTDNYLMNPSMAVPGTYSHPDSHEYGAAGSGTYHFPQHSYNPYGNQFSPSYGQQSNLSSGMQHLQYASDHTIPSMSTTEDMRLHHPPPQYMAQPRYLQSPRYLPLRDALGETDIESQESRNEGTLLSEPVVPALDGFPDVKEFDQLMQRFVEHQICVELWFYFIEANVLFWTSYVDDLSVKKQDKALIHAKRARNIRTVLIDPKDTAVESAQFRCVFLSLTIKSVILKWFRFWVKKMFKLQPVGMGTADVRQSPGPIVYAILTCYLSAEK
jgi:hypothetical protein